MLVVSYNPGYQHVLKSLKPSTRQRFVALSFDFPQPEVEISVLQQESGLDAPRVKQLVTLAGQLRRLSGYDLDEGVSTRLLVYAAKLMAAGMGPKLACRTALVEPLTDDADTLAALTAIVETQFV
jgi:nitric oxide reductase NorQ protein